MVSRFADAGYSILHAYSGPRGRTHRKASEAMKVTLNDVNGEDKTITLSESNQGNVIIRLTYWNGHYHEFFVKADELLRATRLFLKEPIDEANVN
jgi:hypothetical protein